MSRRLFLLGALGMPFISTHAWAQGFPLPWSIIAKHDGRAMGSGLPLVVEFLDYNCGFCRLAYAQMPQTLSLLPNTMVLKRDLPVLGPSSLTAVLAVAAAAQMGVDGVLHDALMRQRGRLTDQSIAEAISVSGIDGMALTRIMETPQAQTVMQEILSVAQASGLTGTPSYVTRSGRVLMGFGSPQRFLEFMRSEPR